jgi:hypothetical protein
MKSSKNKTFEEEKLEAIQLLVATTKPELIKKVKGVLLEEEIDWWDELTDEQKAELEESIAQANRGEFIAHEEVMNKYKKWFSK